MITLQRKYKVIKAHSLKDLEKKVNEAIQREYKDTEGFIFRSSGRWQCLGGLLREQTNVLNHGFHPRRRITVISCHFIARNDQILIFSLARLQENFLIQSIMCLIKPFKPSVRARPAAFFCTYKNFQTKKSLKSSPFAK